MIYVDLHCSAENVPIRLMENFIKMEDTCLGLTRSRAITICNESDYIVNFKWVRNRSSEEDDALKQKYFEQKV